MCLRSKIQIWWPTQVWEGAKIFAPSIWNPEAATVQRLSNGLYFKIFDDPRKILDSIVMAAPRLYIQAFEKKQKKSPTSSAFNFMVLLGKWS